MAGTYTPGYDLLALMTGSGGMLGIIVAVTVKLLPRPERAQVILVAFDDVKRQVWPWRRRKRRRFNPYYLNVDGPSLG